MKPIEFIFFDLGRVILDFDHQLICQQMAAVAGIDEESAREIVFGSELQQQYESGQIGSDEFVERFNQLAGTQSDAAALLLAGSNIFTVKPRTIALISQLRYINFPMAILSNTCEAHWNFVCQKYPFVRDCFASRVLSYEVGCMKPGEAIYQAATKLANCETDKIFFTDDRQENVDAAIEFGMQATLFRSAKGLGQELAMRDVEFNF